MCILFNLFLKKNNHPTKTVNKTFTIKEIINILIYLIVKIKINATNIVHPKFDKTLPTKIISFSFKMYFTFKK